MVVVIIYLFNFALPLNLTIQSQILSPNRLILSCNLHSQDRLAECSSKAQLRLVHQVEEHYITLRYLLSKYC